MIVVPQVGAGVLLIRQSDHAALSGQLAAAWRRPRTLAPGIWARFVAAVRRHDQGWIEAEAMPELDSAGRPRTFMNLPSASHAAIFRRCVDMAQGEDPYQALLIAQHAQRLCRLYPRPDADAAERQIIADFLRENEQRQERLQAQLAQGDATQQAAAQPSALTVAGSLLAFFDALSLMLAGALPLAPRTDKLAFGDQCVELELKHEGRSRHSLRVRPWPFAGTSLSPSLRGLRLFKSTFAGAEELAQAMKRGRGMNLTWTLRPG